MRVFSFDACNQVAADFYAHDVPTMPYVHKPALISSPTGNRLDSPAAIYPTAQISLHFTNAKNAVCLQEYATL